MNIAIFGLGFVGKRLLPSLQKSHNVNGYSMNTQISNSHIFNASDGNDCAELAKKQYDASVITFPLNKAHPQFLPTLFSISKHNILLGTTGIYRRTQLGKIITENTPLKTDHSRCEKEKEFVENGGTILRLSGIYGDERNPINWLKSPRIGYCKKQLNLIHVVDITEATKRVLEKKPKDSVYNLSDGQTHTWKQIIDYALDHNLIERREKEVEVTENSFVANTRFCEEYRGMVFQDLFDYLC